LRPGHGVKPRPSLAHRHRGVQRAVSADRARQQYARHIGPDHASSKSAEDLTRKLVAVTKEIDLKGKAHALGLLFGDSNEDIAALDEAEFQEVWAALGKVARARARKPDPKSEKEPQDGEVGDEDG
jgi:hypothetical protein